MLAKVLSSAVLGIDAYIVEVEIDIGLGLPFFFTVGLPDGAVKESKDRVRSALRNCGFEFPSRRITVNLAPADVRKEGAAFDLPIGIGILSAQGIVDKKKLSNYVILGELSLDGQVKPIKGALPIAVTVKSGGLKGLIIPKRNVLEAAVVSGIDVLGVEHLGEVVDFLNSHLSIEAAEVDLDELFRISSNYPLDFQDVKGQEHAKRALEVAAAGGHNILLIGPPGAGKTMLAQRLPTILPSISFSEAIEATKIYSVTGLLPSDHALIATRPFRSPHHTISDAGLIGGGPIPRPGEVSLAHNGVLFLDELPEFKKNVLEVLRQPIEDGKVTISRAFTSLTYPASFMMVAAMNPCPCGYFSDPYKECSCSLAQIQRYRSKVSGPLLDRIDIQIEVPALRYKEISSERTGESSEVIKKRVDKARQIQLKRFAGKNFHCNARMGSRELKEFCKVDKEGYSLLEMAIDKLGLSARAYTRILKVSRTIADLEGSNSIHPDHISEAIQYRSLDRNVSGLKTLTN